MSRVEYILGLWQPPSGHSVGINTVQKSGNGVLSGGRDGRVCGWLPNRPDPILQYDAHTDWVNGLYELNGQIWSCSSDTTVKCYSNNQLFTVGAHQDYAKCLAGTSEHVYSAGLDGQIISWSPDGLEQSSVQVKGDMGSVYSLAACGNLFVSGGPDSIVRLWDSRQPQEARSFTGHGDNVRALLMNDDWIVSGSSDATVRLWNIRSGRTFKTWDNYSDSVYSLFSNDNLQSWYSGDRQGQIHWTSREGKNVLVSEQSNPVEGVVEQQGIWTSGHYLRYWDDVNTQDSNNSPSPTSTPASTEPSMVIAPHDSLLKTMMLNDKRRVIVAATNGSTALIDIIRGTVVEKLPPVDTNDISQSLTDLAEQYNTQDVLDNWCSVGIRAGRLVINLEERSAGCTEVYADEFGPAMGLDLGDCDDERRVNLGKLTIQALFANFAAVEQPRVEQLRANQAQLTKNKDQEAQEAEQPKKERSKFSRMFSLRRSSRNTEDRSNSTSAGNASQSGAAAKPEKRETYAEAVEAAAENDDSVDLPTFKLPDDTRILISKSEPGQGAATAVFDSIVADIGTERNVEQLRKLLPGWIGEALWLPKMSSRAPARIGFNMVPIDDNHPAILQNKGRLLANPVLRARKAMAYVISSLKENGDLKDVDGLPDDHIELYCQDELVSPFMTLAMIRTRMWRSGGDVVLKYRFKNSPPIQPGSAATPASAANTSA